ncbi:MAG TPA: manganese efflux pump MntP family protein [Kofleriaceae bacterium]|jgi:putative Mn2+ efflux pump MntP
MALASVSILAVGLAMDATAAAAARGAAPGRGPRLAGALRVGLLFGAFQALMPLGGWLVGDRAGSLVAAWDHWIAFAILTAIAIKMAYDGLRGGTRAAEDGRTGWRVLLVLALATSIDAFAAGLTLPLLGAPVAISLAIIFAVTAGLSGAAFLLGARLSSGAGRWIEVVGAALLFVVALRILTSHLG